MPNHFALEGWRKELHTLPDCLGISSEVSYQLVRWLGTFGSILLAAGLLIRLHALGIGLTMLVAWGLHHGMRFSGPNAGEVPFAFAAVYLLLFLAGPGQHSLDRRFGLVK